MRKIVFSLLLEEELYGPAGGSVKEGGSSDEKQDQTAARGCFLGVQPLLRTQS